MPRNAPTWSVHLSLAVLVLVLTGCGAAGSSPAGRVPWEMLPKYGRPSQSVLLKLPPNLESQASAAPTQPELAAIVAALKAVLTGRPGTYQAKQTDVFDNATVAAQDANPATYAKLLQEWGRETGYRAVFDLTSPPTDAPGLLRASITLSHYHAAAGAHAAYAYVIERQGANARQRDLTPTAGAQTAWDEAVIVYREEQNTTGQKLGYYTFIFRSGTLIGFVANVGMVDSVTPRDTMAMTQALFTQLNALP